jgi:RNA polymerase subunit RPABC4/transcription elongation factor Spt4
MNDFYTLLIALWVGSALFGMAWVGSKGYFSGMAWNAGCMFVLVGWWAIPLLLILGPIWLLIAASLEQKQQCPHCKKMIPGSAARCSFCQGEVVPLIKTSAPASIPMIAIPALVATEPDTRASDDAARLNEQVQTDASVEEPDSARRTCAGCGSVLLAEARFCMQCGATVETL